MMIFFIGNLPYLLIFFGCLIVIISLIFLFRRNKKLAKRIMIIAIVVAVLAGLWYAFVYFKVYPIVRDFIIVYLYYILTGIALLVLILVFLNYAKKIVDFFNK